MQIREFPKNKDVVPVVYRLYFLFAILQGLGTLALIFQVKSEEGTHLLLGLSSTRLIIALVFLLFTLIPAILLAETRIKEEKYNNRLQLLIRFLNRRTAWGLAMILLGGVFLLGSYFITLYPGVTDFSTREIIIRLLPIAVWITGMSAQTFIALLVMRHGADLFKFRPRGASFYLSSLVLGGMFLAWSLIMQEIYATESQLTGWNNMGVPVIETQLFIAWGAGMAMLVITALVKNNPDRSYWFKKLIPQKSDLLIALMIWLITVMLWQSVPITPSWFLSEPTYPNFQNYPTSDARSYDVVGQTALVGEGYLFINSPIIKRPLHALYITFLRLLGGQDYDKVVTLQILVLAFFPVLIYYLTRKFYNQASGIMAAVIIMLREANSIAVAGTITASHVKLIMVDLPAAFMNLIFVLLTIQMLQQIKRTNLISLVAGAALGFSMLVRLEAFVFLFPLVAIMAIMLFPKKQYSTWIKGVLLFLLGIMLVILPWIWRNWEVTGIVYFDSPYFRYRLIAQRFRPVDKTPIPSKEVAVTTEATESSTIYPTNTPILVTSQVAAPTSTLIPPTVTPSEEERVRKTMEQAISYIIGNPHQLVSNFMAHYLNSQLQTILIMPSSFRAIESLTSFLGHRSISTLWEDCCSLDDYVHRMPYWHKWDSRFPSQSVLPLIINSIILATGVHVTWKRHRLIGIVPIFYCITYLVFNSIFRNSGGRYVLPVDWIVVVYFSIGLAHITICLINSFTRTNVFESQMVIQNQSCLLPKSKSLLRSPKFYTVLIIILLLSSTIPLVERSFPRLYTESRKQEMLKTLFQSDLLSDPQRQDLQSFIAQGGSVFAGRALYPQYFKANAGGIGDRSSLQSPKPYSRLIFYLTGQYNSALLMPIKEKPSTFPNASDVIVFMCPQEEVLAVAVYKAPKSPQAIWMNSSYPSDSLCLIPLPETEE